MEISTFERTLTDLDHARLSSLLRRGAGGQEPATAGPGITDVLAICAIVPARQLLPDVVTMNSQVLLADATSGQRSALTLCYPANAEPSVGRVSVLSPVGASLLGLSAGDMARWSTPAGDERAAEILAVTYQPEASGDYTA